MGKMTISSSNQLSSIVNETFSLSKVILGFANQKKILDRLGYAFDIYFLVFIKFMGIRFAIPLIYSSLGIAVFIITIFTGRKFGVPLSEITALIYILYKVVISISRITTGKSQLDNFFPSYEQLQDLRYNADKLKQKTGSKIFTGIKEKIDIENLCYSYPTNEPTLTDINITIPCGKMIAIVGESGSGKSTLIDLLMGFDEPSTGYIKIDDTTLQEFDITSYRKRIGYVPQDSMLFNMTIRENLLWANEYATEDEIKQACKQANAEEFIREFLEGYNTLVGDRGVRLSGGQIQRISLARAILKKPDILILDEATSALDSASEKLIQEAIEDIARKTTVIIIAHRLSSIVNADYIYVLKKGQIVEKGTYRDLTQKKGEFDRMVQLQSL
ncbi:MAG: Heterocyst differentiation ATP-binding protein HepA [bacterium ADurb.Bin363]|nr:MAG: Heterocyst differentiation ATP-binding protein HepA [bacterium ADurb.Bin363]